MQKLCHNCLKPFELKVDGHLQNFCPYCGVRIRKKNATSNKPPYDSKNQIVRSKSGGYREIHTNPAFALNTRAKPSKAEQESIRNIKSQIPSSEKNTQAEPLAHNTNNNAHSNTDKLEIPGVKQLENQLNAMNQSGSTATTSSNTKAIISDHKVGKKHTFVHSLAVLFFLRFVSKYSLKYDVKLFSCSK